MCTPPKNLFSIQRTSVDIQHLIELSPIAEIKAIFKSNETIVCIEPYKYGNDFPFLIEFHINNKKYPFLPPIVTINNKSYYEYITPISKRIQRIIEEQRYLCFSTIVTSQQWLPTYQLHDILNEIKEIAETKRMIQKRLLIEDIGKKYHLPKVLETAITEYWIKNN
jgi:ubiquitin-protein ligase